MNDAISIRRGFGKFATGVTVVTCLDATGKPCGITANSFSSVSLDPPLILWNIARVSNSLEAYLSAEYFAISILAHEQEALARHFARSDHTLFDEVDYTLSDNGVPWLPGTVANIECRTHQVHEAGDHHIIIGEVTALRSSERSPLLFYSGRYHALECI